MSDKSIAARLAIKPGQCLLLVNPPTGYKGTIGVLPPGSKIVPKATEPVDAIQFFCGSRQELHAQLPKLRSILKPNGMLWITYHKGTSKVKTDINRDTIAAYTKTIGLQAVAMISIDDDWSALRCKPV